MKRTSNRMWGGRFRLPTSKLPFAAPQLQRSGTGYISRAIRNSSAHKICPIGLCRRRMCRSGRDLPQSGKPAPHARVQIERFSVPLYLCLHDRTRPHEAHMPQQHIPQLREFVQAAFAQKCAHAGNARIVFQLVRSLPLLPRFGCVSKWRSSIRSASAAMERNFHALNSPPLRPIRR